MSQELKTAYGHAKLSRFNMVALEEIENHRKECAEFQELIKQKYDSFDLNELHSVGNQCHVLGHAYMCLVWLREAVMASSGKRKREDQHRFVDVSIVSRMSSETFKMIKKTSGSRDLSSNAEKLRLIRNGLGHARVKIEEQTFVISDRDPNKENSPTSVELPWATLEYLCDAFGDAVHEHLFPEVKNGE